MVAFIAAAAIVAGCASVWVDPPSASPLATPSPAAPPPTAGPTPSLALTPTAVPQPTPPATAPVHLDWRHDELPADDGCRTAPEGWACEDNLVVAFGGVVLQTPDASGFGWRWEWTTDGRRWRDLPVPKDTVWLEADGRGAFAFTETWTGDTETTALWRSVDGSSWRRVAETSAWGGDQAFAVGNGHYLIVSNGPDTGEPNRLFSSADGWTWQEVPLPEMAQAVYVRIDGDEAGFVAQWWTEDEAMFSTSEDGRTWSAPQPLPGDAVILYRLPWGLVAFEVDGAEASPDGVEGGLVAAWTSAKGKEWTRHETVGQPSYEDDSMMFVARIYPVPGGFLLDLYQQDKLFFSSDGVNWTPVNKPPEDECFVRDIPVRGNLVCLGDDWGYWIAQIASP